MARCSPGPGVWWSGVVERSLFEARIAVEVAAGRLFLFVAEPERDHHRADVGLEECHRGGVPEGVSGDLLGLQRWAALGGDSGVFGDQPFDGVAAERPTVGGREQRVGGLALAFFEPDPGDLDGLAGERDRSLLAVLALGEQVAGRAEPQVLAAQAGEFGDAQPGLDRGQQQRVVTPAGPGVAVRCGERCLHLVGGEEVDQRAVESFGGDRESRAIMSACSGCRKAA